MNFYSALFVAPNNWRLETDGKLTKSFETPEFKEAGAYQRDMYVAGGFQPSTIK